MTLEPPSTDESGIPPPTILLNVSYPESYPDVAPNLDLTSPPNAPKYPFLDVSEDRITLLEGLQSTIEESMGMSMIFSVVSTLKDLAETLIADRQRQLQELKDMEVAKAEEVENRKFHGTVVTPERFLEWRDRFRKEMLDMEQAKKEEEEAEDKKKRGGRVEEKRLTGRQLWERGLVGKVDEEDEDGDGAVGTVVDGVEKLKVAA